MKYWILILVPTFLLFTAPDIRAHNLVTVSGHNKNHQHVYRRQQYGKPLQQGHIVNPSGGGGMIVWGANTQPAYGKSTVRRSGPIIEDQKTKPGTMPDGHRKYNSVVKGYGKPVLDYGKPDRDK